MDHRPVIKDLIDYLSEQYMKIIEEKETLMNEKYQLEESKERIAHFSAHQDDRIQVRKVFSPLKFQNQAVGKNSFDLNEINDKIIDLESLIVKSESEAQKIKQFIDILKEDYKY